MDYQQICPPSVQPHLNLTSSRMQIGATLDKIEKTCFNGLTNCEMDFFLEPNG